MSYSIINTGRHKARQSADTFSQLARIEQRNQAIEDQMDNADEAQRSQAAGTAAGLGYQFGRSDTGRNLTHRFLGGGESSGAVGGQNAVNEVTANGSFASGAESGAVTTGGEAAATEVLGANAFAGGAETGAITAGEAAVADALAMETVGAVGAEAAATSAGTTAATTMGTTAATTAGTTAAGATASGAAAGPLAAMGPVGWAAAAGLLAYSLF